MENNSKPNTLEEALKLKAEGEKALGMEPSNNNSSNISEDGLSPWQRFKAAQGNVRPWDMLKADGKTTDAIAHSRYSICQGCEHFINLTKQCKKCGCFMNLKTKLAGAECPVGKWKAVNVLEEDE